ncbi:MAG: dihydrofolate reductase, partial [Pyrinomonadaceae bacterium]|nr:dihydrofolate reductase [Pyrinomonadaceae bacterium]
IIGIVAVDKNNAIGKGGQLPWHYSADLKFFKQQTIGNACVMGHRTWRALKKPLPQRLNIVLSRSSEIEAHPSLVMLRDRLSVLSLAPYLARDLYIIGGAQIYSSFLEDIDRWIVTAIPLEVEGADAFMPENFLDGFRPSESRELEKDLTATFYERR